MKKGTILRALLITVVLVLVAAAGIVVYARTQISSAVVRAENLFLDLQKLRVGASSYQEAKHVADKYGTSRYESHWGILDCSDGYFENCAYVIPVHKPAMRKLLTWAPSILRLGMKYWNGSAFISIKDGAVQGYSFSVVFESTDGQWRGFGAEEASELPETAVQAVISKSYVVSRHDVVMSGNWGGKGFELESSVTPQASQSERQRAWHFRFGCLSQSSGCEEICDALPDAWRDFYSVRGRFDAEKFGSRYMFCRDSERIK